jgi:putative glutamine amidotransferase
MAPRILLSASLKPQPYIDMVIAAGGEPSSIYCPDLDTSYDGLIVCGGPDVDPALYREEVNGSVGIVPQRDQAEMALIEGYVKAGKPILGVCRGAQILNVYFGGTLHQHLSNAEIHTPGVPEVYIPHSAHAEQGSVLHALYGSDFSINSHHHQAVKDLAPGLEVMGKSSDGIVEALRKPDERFLWAVQWHPERIWDIEASSAKLFQAFLEACRE